MGVENFSIVFDKPDRTYAPGDMLTGKVLLALDAAAKIRGIELLIKGRGKCEWTDSERYRDRRGNWHTRYYNRSETEIYLRKEMVLIGGTNISIELSTGEYSYPFSVPIPFGAPSTFRGSHGNIMYYATAKLDIPKGTGKNHTSYFTVISRVNLHFYPQLRAVLREEENQSFCCLCCASGPLTVVVHVARAAFEASESIPITVEVNNASFVNIRAVFLLLQRNIVFKAQGYHKYEGATLRKKRLGNVPRYQTFLKSENLEIPHNSYPFLGSCSIIKFRHSLHIEAHTPGLHKNLRIDVPIVIGESLTDEDPDKPAADPQAQAQTDSNMAPSSGSSSLSSQPDTDSENSINASPVIPPGESSTLLSIDTNPKLENPSLLNNSENSNAKNATVSPSLMSSSAPSAPPSS